MSALDLALDVIDQHADTGRHTPAYQWAARVAFNHHTHHDGDPARIGCTRCDIVRDATARLRRHTRRHPQAA